MIRGLVLDYNRTLYDPDADGLMEGAKEFLEWCHRKRLRLALVSRGDASRHEDLKKFGIHGYFTKILVLSDGNKGPHHFEECARALALEPREIAVIGDRARAELKHGKAAGMKTIWYRKGKYTQDEPESEDEKPDAIVGEFSEIKDVLPAL